VNDTPLLATPLTVTTTVTVPGVKLDGTVATIDVLLQVAVAGVPLNVTVLEPCVEPKFAPVIVTDEPRPPEVGVRLLIFGAAFTVNFGPEIETPLAVTATVPVVAPVGTTATIDVAVQLLIVVAAVPLNFTVPVVVPKFVPVIVTVAPTAPEFGDRLLIVGVARTVNEEPALDLLLTVTTTLPVVAPVGTFATIDVALQLVIEVAEVPLNFTVLAPCVVPKFVPVIVTEAPTAPEVGDRLLIVGVAETVNVGPVTETPLAVTTTVPVVAPVGTAATIEVAVQLLIVVAVVPLNFTVPVVVPKLVPVIVTEAPTAPEVGLRLVIVGVESIVNVGPVTEAPLAVTATVPVVAPVGTTATIDDAVQLLIVVAVVPLNFTVPVVVPKFVPVIVTEAPTAPEVGDRLLIAGVASSVNEEPALDAPPTVTTTLPVVAPVGTFATIEVALQLVIEVAEVPLNFTVLAPCVVPKFVPVIVTEAPTAPEVGLRFVIVGVESTVNVGPVTEAPLAVTATAPVVAPVGTFATIEVAVQLLIVVAVVPLNFTVPVVVPKFVPVIVTEAPTAPEVGDRLLIAGVARTVNEEPALDVLLTVTTTLPVVAPVGTFATIDVALQLVIEVAEVPLNFTVLLPCVVPKLVPVIVTEALTAPEVGLRLLIVGVAALATAEVQ
jgi:hypothetical protein